MRKICSCQFFKVNKKLREYEKANNFVALKHLKTKKRFVQKEKGKYIFSVISKLEQNINFLDDTYWQLSKKTNCLIQRFIYNVKQTDPLKFSFSEKATKIWWNLPHDLDITQ